MGQHRLTAVKRCCVEWNIPTCCSVRNDPSAKENQNKMQPMQVHSQGSTETARSRQCPCVHEHLNSEPVSSISPHSHNMFFRVPTLNDGRRSSAQGLQLQGNQINPYVELFCWSHRVSFNWLQPCDKIQLYHDYKAIDACAVTPKDYYHTAADSDKSYGC